MMIRLMTWHHDTNCQNALSIIVKLSFWDSWWDEKIFRWNSFVSMQSLADLNSSLQKTFLYSWNLRNFINNL